MPATIMGFDVMESYVVIKRPGFFLFKSVLIRFKCLRKLFIRSMKVSNSSRQSFGETLVYQSDSASTAEGSDHETRSAIDQNSRETWYSRDDDKDTNIGGVCLIEAEREIDRICPQICYNRNDSEEDAKMAIEYLDQAMDLLQSDFIAKSRSVLRDAFELVSRLDSRNFKTPSYYDVQVVERGEELFWTWGGQKGVSCSVKHGIITLDSGNAHFYARLVNVLGAFATETSEFQIAERSFSILIELHEQSNLTSRLRGMGASFNNRGCIFLITGEYKQASSDFQNSQIHLHCCKNEQFCGPTIDSMMIAVQSNTCRLDMSCRYFSKAVTEQKRLVEKCKAEDNELPFQTAFMILLNQATLYTTLAMFAQAEKELKFLKTLCEKMKRDECDLLLNFIRLQLGEVLLLRAKQDEAERAFPFEALTSASVQELMPVFHGLHVNVRIESFEKMIDVLVQIGRIKFARELLEKGLKFVKNVFGFDHFNVASLLYKQGTILTLTGELASAIKKFADAKEIWRLIFGEKHLLLINCYTSLGDIAFRLDRADESNLYFQRAMENIEIIHQVSLPDQLSMKYLALTRSTKDNSHWEYQQREIREEIVEGLVAEYGLALAVLVPQLGLRDIHASRKKKQKGKQQQVGKVVRVQHSESTLIISQKCMRDLLQSGKKFLQHGMTKEAVAFFKEASRYGMTNNITCPNAALVHMYTIISQTKLTSTNTLKIPDLKSYLEEVKAEAEAIGNEKSHEGHSEDEEMLPFDNQMTLKLLLIFFLFLSIHLQAHDTTFAAYDFYASQFPNEDQCFLTLDGELQVYASRKSVTCNGQTAVQDVFVVSSIFENKSDWVGNLDGNPLFRSLAYRSNQPSCNLVAALSSPFLMDIEDVKKLEQKVLHSFQEFVQLKCLGFDSNATQAVVDLTSFCEQDIMTCGGRIELLPLCLFEQVSQSKIPIVRGTISEMTPGLCERITCMSFTDKQTTWAMFSKISLWFLKNCTWEDKSTLRPQDECLVLTFLDPVRARVTLWHKDLSIMQKVQVIRITDRTTQLDEVRQEFNFHEHFYSSSSPCCKAIEQFTEPLISTHGVGCKVNVVRRQCAFSDGPQNALDNYLEPTVLLSHDAQQEKEDSLFYSEENEEAPRTDVQVSTLKLLTEISKLSRELSENEIRPEDEITTHVGKSTLGDIANPPDEESMSYPERSLTSSGAAAETMFSDFEQTSCSYERDTQSIDSSSSRSHHPVNTETDQLSVNEKVLEVQSKDDDVSLGRKLFEEDKESRNSFITEIQGRLRKKEMRQEMNSKGNHVHENMEPKDELSSLVEASGDEASQNVFSKNIFASFGGGKDTYGENVSKEHETVDIFQKENTNEAKNRGGGPCSSKPLNYSASQKGTWEDQSSIEKSAVGIALPSPGDTGAIANEPCGVLTSDGDMVFYDCHHERKCELQMGRREISQDENAERRAVNGNGLLQENESIQTNDKDPTQSKCSVDLNVIANSTSRKEVSVSGYLEKNFAYFHGDHSRSLAVTELTVKRAESHVESHDKKFPRDFGDGRYGDERRKLSKEDAKNGWNKEVSIKSGEQNSVLLPMENCLASGCHASNPSPKALKDVIDGSSSPNSSTQDREKVKTSSFLVSFQRESTEEDNYSSRPFLETTEDVVSGGPALSNVEYISKNCMQNNSRSTFYGGDVIADGYTPEVSSQRSEPCRVNPALKAVGSSQPNAEEEGIILEGGRADGGVVGLKNIDEWKHIHNHCPNNFGDPDVIDGPVEQKCSNNTDISHSHLDFGGARPKQSLFVAGNGYSASAGRVDLTYAYPPREIGAGLDPEFVERHAVNNSLLTSRLYNTNVNGATWDDPRESNTQEHYFSARTYVAVNSMHSLTAYGPLNSRLSKSSCRRSSRKDIFAGSSTVEGSVRSRTISHVPFSKQDKSWHFPSPPVNSEHCVRRGNLLASDHSDSAKYFDQETLLQGCEPLFHDSTTRSPYQEMRSLADEYMIEQGSQGEATEHSESCTEEHSVVVSELKPDSNQGSQESLLEHLRMVMSATVNLFASISATEEQVKQDKNKDQQTEKLSIQEEAVGQNCDRTGTDGEEYLGEQAASLPRNERTTDTEEEDHTSPVQESPRPACGHYQRRCLVRFPCCGRFYPCHRCHNESAACTDDQARAINATHIRCTICYHEQVIDEGSQKCRGCNLKLADYFCAICKHFTSLDKNPFHCDKCGICRIHRDKSFHCNVCNVCLDKRLQGKHKCRPDSGHDECCICLEDAFSGCQILPCSHKVHKDCAIAMIQNGIRTCPICRHPLFQQSESSEQ